MKNIQMQYKDELRVDDEIINAINDCKNLPSYDEVYARYGEEIRELRKIMMASVDKVNNIIMLLHEVEDMGLDLCLNIDCYECPSVFLDRAGLLEGFEISKTIRLEDYTFSEKRWGVKETYVSIVPILHLEFEMSGLRATIRRDMI